MDLEGLEDPGGYSSQEDGSEEMEAVYPPDDADAEGAEDEEMEQADGEYGEVEADGEPQAPLAQPGEDAFYAAFPPGSLSSCTYKGVHWVAQEEKWRWQTRPTLVDGTSHLGSGLATSARAAAEARDAHLRALHAAGQLSDAQLRRTLCLGEAAQQRSRVRGVCHYSSGHAPTDRPWSMRVGGAQPVYYSTQREAEAAALVAYTQQQHMQQAQDEMPDEEEEEQPQRQMGPTERGRLVVAFAVAGTHTVPAAPTPLESPAEDFVAEEGPTDPEGLQDDLEEGVEEGQGEGLAGSSARQQLQRTSRHGGLLLRMARFQRRWACLAATTRGVLRPAMVPPQHHLLRLAPRQAVQVMDEQSRRRQRPFLPGCDLDHIPPLVWGRAQDASAQDLDGLAPECRVANRQKASMGVRRTQTADGSEGGFEETTRQHHARWLIDIGSETWQAIQQHQAESAAIAAETRRLADEIGGGDRVCPCALCAHLRGELLTTSQLRQLEQYVLDDVYRHVVCTARSQVDIEVIPPTAVLSTGALGDTTRFLSAWLPHARDGMLCGRRGADRRLPDDLPDLIAAGAAAWADELPVTPEERRQMRCSAEAALQRRFRLAEAARAEWEAGQAAAEERLRRAVDAMEQMRALAAAAFESWQQGPARAAARAVGDLMPLVVEAHGELSAEHMWAFGLQRQLLESGDVRFPRVYSAEEAMSFALQRGWERRALREARGRPL